MPTYDDRKKSFNYYGILALWASVTENFPFAPKTNEFVLLFFLSLSLSHPNDDCLFCSDNRFFCSVLIARCTAVVANKLPRKKFKLVWLSLVP